MSEDRFISPAPLPTPYQRELMVVFMEELAETAQRISKAIRFGLDEVQPGQPDSNLVRLCAEFGDAYAVYALLLTSLPEAKAHAAVAAWTVAFDAKAAKLDRFLQTKGGRS